MVASAGLTEEFKAERRCDRSFPKTKSLCLSIGLFRANLPFELLCLFLVFGETGLHVAHTYLVFHGVTRTTRDRWWD